MKYFIGNVFSDCRLLVYQSDLHIFDELKLFIAEGFGQFSVSKRGRERDEEQTQGSYLKSVIKSTVCHKIHRDAFIITLSNTVCRIYLDCTETIILIQTEEIFQFPIQIPKPKDLWDPSSSAHTNWVIHVIQKSNQLGTEEPPLDMIQVWRCGEAQTESLD